MERDTSAESVHRNTAIPSGVRGWSVAVGWYRGGKIEYPVLLREIVASCGPVAVVVVVAAVVEVVMAYLGTSVVGLVSAAAAMISSVEVGTAWRGRVVSMPQAL